jgi:hypothetical protein
MIAVRRVSAVGSLVMARNLPDQAWVDRLRYLAWRRPLAIVLAQVVTHHLLYLQVHQHSVVYLLAECQR